MLQQYVTLTKCMVELEESRLPLVETCRLKMQLVQTKRTLLKVKVEAKVRDVASSEKKFFELHDWVTHICGPEGSVKQAVVLISHLDKMRAELQVR